MLNSNVINGLNCVAPGTRGKLLFTSKPTLLTMRELSKKTHVCQLGQITLRKKNHLFWTENQSSATLPMRIEFINKLLDHIKQMDYPRTSPLTFISLGSAGLLMEWFIHERLVAAGYEKINWRLIDLGYKNNPIIDGLLGDFSRKVSADSQIFTSDRDYFSRLAASDSLSIDDRAMGACIVLAVCPPTQLPGPALSTSETICPEVCLRIRGKTVENIAQANSIYAMIAKPEEIQPIARQLFQGLEDIDTITWLSNVAKFHIDQKNDVQITYSADLSDKSLKKIISSYIQQARDVADHIRSITDNRSDEFNLSLIDKAIQMFKQSLAEKSLNQLICTTFLVSDYD